MTKTEQFQNLLDRSHMHAPDSPSPEPPPLNDLAHLKRLLIEVDRRLQGMPTAQSLVSITADQTKELRTLMERLEATPRALESRTPDPDNRPQPATRMFVVGMVILSLVVQIASTFWLREGLTTLDTRVYHAFNQLYLRIQHEHNSP